MTPRSWPASKKMILDCIDLRCGFRTKVSSTGEFIRTLHFYFLAQHLITMFNSCVMENQSSIPSPNSSMIDFLLVRSFLGCKFIIKSSMNVSLASVLPFFPFLFPWIIDFLSFAQVHHSAASSRSSNAPYILCTLELHDGWIPDHCKPSEWHANTN
eukprot:TRINITY_DN525_c6_g1_i3.p2 TRINITY_DN525_c6_g1~~TRINITY_DN525_c6_g1_i3.p2  ORF type:complete len:156 (+),score=18.66 TRINITY_DN525_c6_g1_i3:481-948(+)